MSCCVSAAEFALSQNDRSNSASEMLLASRSVSEGLLQTDLSVPGIHCGACIQTIERALGALPGVETARVNFSTKRVTVRWDAGAPAPPLVESLGELGFQAHLDDGAADDTDVTLDRLIRALAVAGFATSNIMLLSASVWLGADPSTRDLFHALSAVIAFAALAYSGRIFFASACNALRRRHTNMDVPISIGVLLAFGLSLYETVHGGQHAYFDAAVALLFFLLIGRTLDYMMRERARTAVKGLANLGPRGALTVQADGSRLYVPVAELEPGMTILLAAGERVAVDARIVSGRSELDISLVSGESLPCALAEGALVQAGALNLTAPLTLIVVAAARDSFLADMIRLMEIAESGRSTYRRIADRAASLYAPLVHAAALATLLGWLFATGDFHQAITIAIAVLIITCPCALGLAVPMVQVMAARRLFERGILLKDGGALERLAEIDCVVFDKTGTLTCGIPRLVNSDLVEPDMHRLAAAMARHSTHPYSRALAASVEAAPQLPSSAISETSGCGLEARLVAGVYRLGRPEWALGPTGRDIDSAASVVLAKNEKLLAIFHFDEELRRQAGQAIEALSDSGLPVEILSGDRTAAVRRIANVLRLPYTANATPETKAARIDELKRTGRKVLMIGDGINDAPALAAAHASMAPASAADIGRNAADLVFMHDSLLAAPDAISIARAARKLVRQNLSLAVGYNLIAVPIAVLGHVTPLIAAVAMSFSSIIVVANALRLRGKSSHRKTFRSPAISTPLAAKGVA